MSRPAREPHPIEAELAKRLRPNSVAVIGSVAWRIQRSGLPARTWLRREIDRRALAAKQAHDPELAMPKRTLGTYRVAVAWYIALVEEPGGDPKKIALSLPTAQPLRAGRDRNALEDDALSRYIEVVSSLEEPYRTVLLLLPLTGCRIHEVCGLLHSDVEVSRNAVMVRGKGAKNRWVEMGPQAWRLLSEYLATHDQAHAHVFMLDTTASGLPRAHPEPVTPHEVRRVLREATRSEPLLEGVTPHVLRHTSATRQLRAGANIRVIQEVLGHRNIRSLERYLHPTGEEKRAALTGAEIILPSESAPKGKE